jgi:hypothetical protein
MDTFYCNETSATFEKKKKKNLSIVGIFFRNKLVMKGLKFPTCKKQGAFFYTNPQIYKLHGFKSKHKLGFKKNKIKPK